MSNQLPLPCLLDQHEYCKVAVRGNKCRQHKCFGFHCKYCLGYWNGERWVIPDDTKV